MKSISKSIYKSVEKYPKLLSMDPMLQVESIYSDCELAGAWYFLREKMKPHSWDHSHAAPLGSNYTGLTRFIQPSLTTDSKIYDFTRPDSGDILSLRMMSLDHQDSISRREELAFGQFAVFAPGIQIDQNRDVTIRGAEISLVLTTQDDSQTVGTLMVISGSGRIVMLLPGPDVSMDSLRVGGVNLSNLPDELLCMQGAVSTAHAIQEYLYEQISHEEELFQRFRAHQAERAYDWHQTPGIHVSVRGQGGSAELKF